MLKVTTCVCPPVRPYVFAFGPDLRVFRLFEFSVRVLYSGGRRYRQSKAKKQSKDV